MYGKLFKSTFSGSMMAAGADVFAVWAYVIAHAVNAKVELNPRLLAAVIGAPVDRMRAAIETLCAPDAESRSPEMEGRRLIREGEFQYHVVNHAHYRNIRNEDDRREYNRLAKQRERARKKSSEVSLTVIDPSAVSAHTDTDTEAEALHSYPNSVIAAQSVAGAPVKKPKKQGTRLSKDWHLPLAWGQWAQAAYPHWPVDTVREIGARFKDHWTAKTGRDSTKLDWEATWRNWCKSDITQRQFPPPAGVNGNGAETAYQRSKRERVSELTGGLAARVIAPVAPAALTLDLEP